MSHPKTIPHRLSDCIDTMGRRRVGWVLVGLVIGTLVAGSFVGVAQQSGYDLDVEDSIAFPERVVTLEGERFFVSTVVQRDPGEPIRVDADGPTDTEYEVALINADKEILAAYRASGSAELLFGTSQLDPGTYLLVLTQNRTPRAIEPVVIRAYSLEIEAPASGRINSSVNITVRTTRTAPGANLSRVELVFTGEGDTFRGTVPRVDEDTYRVRLELRDTLNPGNYSLFAIAESERSLVFGRPEVLGVSLREPLRVEPSVSNTTPVPVTTVEPHTDTAPPGDRAVITPNPTALPDGAVGVWSHWPWLVVGGLGIAAGGYLLFSRR